MISYNKVILMGRLTRDPELRVTLNGNNICKFGLAMSRKFKINDGTFKEEVTFIDVDVFGRYAEVVSKYFTKGKPIFIEGRLKFDQWKTSSGEKRNKVSVVMESFQFIESLNSETINNDSSLTDQSKEDSQEIKSSNEINDNIPF